MGLLLNIKYKIFLLSIFFLFTNVIKADDAIDNISKHIAKEIFKKMKKMDNQTKIAVAFFQDYSNNDTINSLLGIEITKSVVEQLKIEIEKSNTDIKILFNDKLDNILYDKMQELFFTPTDKNQTQYWKTFLDNQTPDYYLSANYQILDKTIKFRNIKLMQDIYVGNKEITFEQIELPLSDEDIKLLNDYNKNVINLSDIYISLINWESDNIFFATNVINEKKEKIETEILYIGDKYKIELNLTENLYVYCFYYERTIENKKIYVIYPFRNNQDNLLKTGTNFIPQGFYFQPSLPANNQIHIKILVSKEKIPINIVTEITESGGAAPILTEDECKTFLGELNRKKISILGTKDFTFFVKEK